MRRERQLGLTGLVFVLFFTVSGGAFTLEGLVAQVGPVVALLALALIPLLWAVPEALLIGELASMLPVEGGYYRWVSRAFGERTGFVNAWCTWLYSLVEMALYPAIVRQYLQAIMPQAPMWVGPAVTLAVIWIPTVINLRGARSVGRASVLVGGAVLLAFTLVGGLALPRITHAPWAMGAGAAPPLDLGTLGAGLSLAIWNWIGWDNASTVMGEIRDPARTYPRALAIAVPLVALGYFVPLLPALAADDWRLWSDGAWPVIAARVTGGHAPWLGPVLGLLAMVSATAMFNSLLLAYSRIPEVVAEDGLLPQWLARTDANGTPVHAVLLSAAIYSGLAFLPFGELVSADVLLYALALGLEFAALVHLRRTAPALRGPFRLPLGTAGVALLALVPMTVLLTVVVLDLGFGDTGGRALLLACAAALAGPLVHALLARMRRHRATLLPITPE